MAKRPADKATITPAPQARAPFEEHFLHHKRETTTATSTVSFCTVVTGCGASDIDETESIVDTEVPRPYVVILRNPKVVSDGLRVTIGFLSEDFYESRTDFLGTMFFFIPSLTTAQMDSIAAFAEVAEVYTPRGTLTQDLFPFNPANIPENPDEEPPSFFRNVTHFEPNGTYMRRHVLEKKAEIAQPWYADTHAPNEPMTMEMVMLSWPPGNGPVLSSSGFYRYDDSAGRGTFVYSADRGISPQHNEFSEVKIRGLFPGPHPVSAIMENDDWNFHGTKCVAKAVGKNVGVARRAEEVVVAIWDYHKQIFETWIDALAKIHEDIRSKSRGTRSVVNISISIHYKLIPKVCIDRFGKSFSRRLHPRSRTCMALLTPPATHGV